MPLSWGIGEIGRRTGLKIPWDLFPYRFESGIPHQKQNERSIEMFRNPIARTPFSSTAADDYFNNISADNWGEDVSFKSTLRALVAPRMGADDTLYLNFSGTKYSADYLRQRSTETAVRALYRAESSLSGWVTVHSLDAPLSEDNLAWLALVKSSFTQVYPQWKRLDKITEFYRNTFGVECFVDAEQKKTVIFCEKLDMCRMHYLQCSVLAFLPWYFDPEKGVTEDEMRLIEALRGKDSEKYEEALERLAEKYDFRTLQIRKLLTGFESVGTRKMFDITASRISDIDRSIEDLTSRISAMLRERRDKEIMLIGLNESIKSSQNGSEVAEYFETNKNLYVFSANEGFLTFTVNTYCSYFDEDMAYDMIENPCSYVYDVPDSYKKISDGEMKRLMHAIFTDRTLKLRFCAAYTLNAEGGSVSGLSHFAHYGAESKNRMPNPHIEYYACIGNHVLAITEALKTNNYIGALEQCIASAKSLNFADSTVMEAFMKDMYKSCGKFIELPNGEAVSPAEAVAWLDKEGKNEQTD